MVFNSADLSPGLVLGPGPPNCISGQHDENESGIYRMNHEEIYSFRKISG